MKSLNLIAAGSFAAAMTVAVAAGAATLDDVKARGTLNCGVTTGLAGFAAPDDQGNWKGLDVDMCRAVAAAIRSEEHTSELQSLMRISYAVFCLKKKQKHL